jgi:hypothetical protein
MSNFSEDCDKVQTKRTFHRMVEVMSNFSEDCDKIEVIQAQIAQ